MNNALTLVFYDLPENKFPENNSIDRCFPGKELLNFKLQVETISEINSLPEINKSFDEMCLERAEYFKSFDKKIFLFLEEIDLCKRILDSGGKIYIVNNSKVYHSAKKGSGEDLEIVLEPGYIFKASGANSEKFQNIIIPTEQTFALSKKSKETFKLTGYCCNATRSSAKENTPFVIAGKASGSLMKLCNFINTHPLNPEGIQSAVHCFTDQKDANAITSNPLLKTFVQNLVGSMQNAIQIDQTLYVFKRIYYQLPESQHIKITIRDYAGNIVYEYHNPKLVKRGRYIYDFNLEAQDWAKGLYEVSINSPTATLAKEEFKI